MAKQELPGMDQETKDFIEGQVKKGKARKFFIIAKGVKILLLTVFKKGPFGPKINAAKKSGYIGNVVCGIVTGSGQNLTFLLPGNGNVAEAMKVDSVVEEPPVETAKFRKFFNDNDMKFKPVFEIVLTTDNLPGVEEEDDENTTPVAPPTPPVQQTPPPQSDALTADEPPSAPPPPSATTQQAAPQAPEPDNDGPDSDALQQRFNELKPRLEAAIHGHPDEAEDLTDLADEFDASMKIHDLAVASEWLDKLVEALDELPDVAPAAPPTPPPADGMAAFEARFKQVAPAAIPLAKAGGDQGTAMAGLLRQAQAQRGAGDAVGGMATLDEIERAMQAPPAAPPPPPPVPPEDLAGRFRGRLAQLVPQIKERAGTPTGDEAKRLAGEAAAAAKSASFEQANSLLDDAERTIHEATVTFSSDAPVGHIMSTWRDAKEEVDDQINQITRILKKSQHPFLRDVADLGLTGLAEDTTNVYVGMMASLFDLQGSTGEGRGKAGEKILNAITKYRTFLNSNRVIEVFDTNPLCGPTTIRETLHTAMNRMEEDIQSLV